MAAASLQRFLQVRFGEEQPVDDPTSVAVARTEDLEGANFAQLVSRPALTIQLYRVDYDPTMRAAWSAVGAYQQRSVLALELHFLLSAWGANADEELRILGRAMQALEDTPILGGPLLAGDGWAPGESLQVVLEAMDTAALLRDRKSTRLNSSHANISYAVFCLKKKNNTAPPLTS